MTYLSAIISGIVVGGAYSLLAVGVSLIFSTTGVLNFAHAGLAMVAAYLYGWLGTQLEIAPPLAALATVGAVTLLGVVIEHLVMRRAAEASAITRLMATLGVLALLQGLVLQFFGFSPQVARPLMPAGSVSLGTTGITYQQIAVFVAAVVLVLGLGAFLRMTRVGLAIRAVAQDHTVSRLMGVRRDTISKLNWAIGAFLAAVAGVLIAPLTFVTIGTFPLLLLKALGATLLGGVAGLVGAFFGGFAIGAVEALGSVVSAAPGTRELFILILVLGILVLRRRWPQDLTSGEIPSAAQRGFRHYRAARVIVAASVALLLVYALLYDFWSFTGSVALVYALAGLSLVVLTGWTGQVSLLQGGFVGAGAFGLTWFLNRLDVPFPLAMVAAVAAGTAFSAIVALPALRLRGLQLGIATLVMSAAASEWLFNLRGTSWLIERPQFLLDDRRIFLTLLPITAVLFWMVHNLGTGAWGRMFFAVRRSDETASHFGIHAARVRVQAFVLSGFIASLAGTFFAVLLTSIEPSSFGPLFSISLLLYAVVGGTQSLAGPVIAALVFAVGPQLVKVSQTTASALPDILSGLLVILLIIARPDGLAGFLAKPAGTRQRSAEVDPVLHPRPLPRHQPVARRLSRRDGGSPALVLPEVPT